jgi:BirA family biotin operon repressor/biotin-[acetyl-CoA-carboxylase] ligase
MTLLTGKAAMLDAYRRSCITLHQDVVLVRGEEKRYGHALDIDEEGALIVRYDNGEIAAVNSGEISVRGMYGYA